MEGGGEVETQLTEERREREREREIEEQGGRKTTKKKMPQFILILI